MRKLLILALIIALVAFGCGEGTVKVIKVNYSNTTAKNVSAAVPNITQNVSANISSNLSSNLSSNVTSNITSNSSANITNQTGTTTIKLRNLTVDFLDLQGNSVFIRSPSLKTVIIDGGQNSDGLKMVKYLINKGVSKFDYVFDSNAENYNAGGLKMIMFNFNNSNAYCTAISYDMNEYSGFRDYIHYAAGYSHNCTPVIESESFTIEDDVKLQLFVPYDTINVSNGSPKDDTIVFKLIDKDASFLFLGDCTGACFDYIKKDDIGADVLNVHGAVPQSIIDVVSPKIIVYDNITSETIKPEGVKVYSKSDGVVTIMSDGEKYYISVAGKA